MTTRSRCRCPCDTGKWHPPFFEPSFDGRQTVGSDLSPSLISFGTAPIGCFGWVNSTRGGALTLSSRENGACSHEVVRRLLTTFEMNSVSSGVGSLPLPSFFFCSSLSHTHLAFIALDSIPSFKHFSEDCYLSHVVI